MTEIKKIALYIGRINHENQTKAAKAKADAEVRAKDEEVIHMVNRHRREVDLRESRIIDV